jgi:hypothetical protein
VTARPAAEGAVLSGGGAAGAAGVCGCGAAVRSVRMARGGQVLLDHDPDPAGLVVPRAASDGRGVLAHVLSDAEAAVSTEARWRPHLSCCPLAVPGPGRGRRFGLLMSKVSCAECGEFLPVVLLAIAETTHLNCPPAAAAVDSRQGTRRRPVVDMERRRRGAADAGGR